MRHFKISFLVAVLFASFVSCTSQPSVKWTKVSGDFDLSGELSPNGLDVGSVCTIGLIATEDPAASSKTSTYVLKSINTPKGRVQARLSRRGNIFSIRTGEGDDDADLVLDLPKECYLGIFVCSHNEDVEETAYFRNVRLQEVSDDVRISIFCDHIGTMAAQEKISFFDAALKVRKAGCRGADIRVFQRPEEIRILDSLGFDHASAITDIDYSRDGWENTEERTIAFMKERGFDRVLIVPAILRDWNDEAAKSEARKRIAAFADRLAANGFDPLVEDYDNARSVCYNAERIDALFSLTPALGLVFDTGNFLFCGEDTLDNLAHFKGKTRHLHLKDRAAPDNMTCVPIGTGCAPISETVAQMLANGYEGYFTVEQYGSRNMLGDCLVSFRNIQDFIAAAKQ